MNKTTALRIFVIADFVMMIASIALSLGLEDRLPPLLLEWTISESNREMTPIEGIYLAFSLPVLGLALIGSIGLFLLKKWGAWCFLLSLVISYALLPLAGPTVEHAIAVMVSDFSIIASGIIIGIAFFSDVFDKPIPADGIPPIPQR